MTRPSPSLLVLLVTLVACGGGELGPDDAGGVDARRPSDATVDALADATDDASSDDASSTDASSTDAAPDAATSRIDAVLALLAAGDAAAIDAAIHDVAWSEGWPLREGSRWLFVTRWDDAPANVSLVSDVNGWAVSADPATRAPSGAHYHVLIDESGFDVPAAGAKYKWFGSPDVYRAPPEATAYGYDGFGEHGWVAPPVDAPHLERFPDLRSAHLDAPRTVRAYLPAGFVPGSASAASARTLLLHDGQNVFDPGAIWGGWHVDDALAAHADVVAIAIDNAPDRMDAYTHTTDQIGGSTVGGRADDYLAMIEDEVLPFARVRYGIVARGDSLMIAGSSLGGLVSIWIAHARPELAGCVAGLSSTLGWGSIGASGGATTLIAQWSGHRSVAVYLDSGGGASTPCADLDSDGIRDDGDDSDNFCVTDQMRDVLVDAGYVEGVDLAHWHAPGAGHDESAWRARFPSVLTACSAMGWSAP